MESEVPSVALEGVSRSFGDLLAVDDIDLELSAGEFFTLLGPSGCGKTTTLRMIAGFEQPSAGRIRIEGEDVAGLPPHRRPTNTVFQSYALFPHLSVEDNVAFGLKRKKVAKGEVRRRVASELDRVGLAEEAKRRPAQLSGGQQQRVALARALVNLPKVLLLDEPLGALDLKLRKGLQVELKRIQREVGITFVYVTHDQEEAMALGDRVAVLRAGRLEQVGTPETLYRAPATPFVATFVGEANFLPVTWHPGAGRLDSPLGSFPVGAAAAARFDGVSRGRLMVRPEAFRLAPEGALAGRVRSATFLGGRRRLTVEVAGAAEPLKVDLPPAPPVVAGDPVRLEIDLAATALLDDFDPRVVEPRRGTPQNREPREARGRDDEREPFET